MRSQRSHLTLPQPIPFNGIASLHYPAIRHPNPFSPLRNNPSWILRTTGYTQASLPACAQCPYPIDSVPILNCQHMAHALEKVVWAFVRSAPQRFIQTLRRTTYKGPHRFLKRMSHGLTIRIGTESMGYGHCAHASRDACVYPVVRSIQEGLLRRGEKGLG